MSECIVPEIGAKRRWRVKIDLPSEKRRQFILLAEQHQSGVVAGQIFHEHIDIARRREILAQHGAKERQTPDAAIQAKTRDLVRMEPNG
jgi:hypothetical protein